MFEQPDKCFTFDYCKILLKFCFFTDIDQATIVDSGYKVNQRKKTFHKKRKKEKDEEYKEKKKVKGPSVKPRKEKIKDEKVKTEVDLKYPPGLLASLPEADLVKLTTSKGMFHINFTRFYLQILASNLHYTIYCPCVTLLNC